MSTIQIGIIGGSGLENLDIFENKVELICNTPFGKTSDILIKGQIKGVTCILLARHGRKHDIMPTNVNYRANVWALKELKCTHIITTNACGSLKEEIKPGDFIFIDQFIDRTTKRDSTFYDGKPDSPKGVCHIPMGVPFCETSRQVLIEVATELGHSFHSNGTIVVIEGPRFSTKAESNIYRSWNADLVGMTTCPEATLAKEAGLSYATIAMATDYDCWREDEESVCVDNVMETFKKNVHKATEIILSAIPKLAAMNWDKILLQNAAEAKGAVML